MSEDAISIWVSKIEMAKHAVLIINGPNLDQLGTREPEIYGHMSLADIEAMCHEAAAENDISISFMQSNAEDAIIASIHKARQDGTKAIIINAAGFIHTSVAIRDAMQMFDGIRIEVHLSNVFAREAFRHHSYLADIANGVICGFGANSYRLAIDAVGNILQSRD